MDPPRPQTVAPDVTWFAARVPTLPPATHTNSYAIGGREVLLVEPATPHPDERRAWLTWARGLRSTGRHLVAIFITHHHPDHIDGAAFFATELGLDLWAHHETATRLPALCFARTLDDGEVISLQGQSPQAWRCLHTPGHAPGHLCLHEEVLGVGIVGDMVASEGTILIDPSDGHLTTYLQQLDRLDALGLTLALPAHGAPIEAPSALFRHYISHRLAREKKVVAALAQCNGPATLPRLVRHAYADTPPHIWPLAQRSLQSHLVKLMEDGVATHTDAGFQLAP